uniref:ATP synthase complex subunit 8 n=1 Tax=Orohermes crepusculus TaxID=1646121 RepID=A0A8K1WB04_9NEOP|nr:ATP synthase F0 subunit 8 [Orohermes crepusculus]
MPQMAPINWLILFVFFSCMLIIFNIFNYFIINPDPLKNNSTPMIVKSMTWKW